MRRDTYVIRSAADLDYLADATPPARLILDLPQMPQAEVAVWQARLIGALSACGCTEGAVGLLVGLAIAILAGLLGWLPGHGGWAMAPGILGLTVLAAALGKLVGLMRARRHIRAEIGAMLHWMDAA